MLFPDTDIMSLEDVKANNRATFQQMVNFKLAEVPDLMDMPSGMYTYPFTGTTHDARRDDLLEHLTPLAEAMGIDHFMRMPVMVTMACLFSAKHRKEADSFPEALHSIQMLFMTLYGSPETSDIAIQAFKHMMSAKPEFPDEPAHTDRQARTGHPIH